MSHFTPIVRGASYRPLAPFVGDPTNGRAAGLLLRGEMAALTTVQEYAAVREAIQLLTTTDTDGNRRDVVSFSLGDMQVSYAANQLEWLQQRERELAKRITQRNSRKRVTPDFSGTSGDYLCL